MCIFKLCQSGSPPKENLDAETLPSQHEYMCSSYRQTLSFHPLLPTFIPLNPSPISFLFLCLPDAVWLKIPISVDLSVCLSTDVSLTPFKPIPINSCFKHNCTLATVTLEMSNMAPVSERVIDSSTCNYWSTDHWFLQNMTCFDSDDKKRRRWLKDTRKLIKLESQVLICRDPSRALLKIILWWRSNNSYSSIPASFGSLILHPGLFFSGGFQQGVVVVCGGGGWHGKCVSREW